MSVIDSNLNLCQVLLANLLLVTYFCHIRSICFNAFSENTTAKRLEVKSCPPFIPKWSGQQKQMSHTPVRWHGASKIRDHISKETNHSSISSAMVMSSYDSEILEKDVKQPVKYTAYGFCCYDLLVTIKIILILALH